MRHAMDCAKACVGDLNPKCDCGVEDQMRYERFYRRMETGAAAALVLLVGVLLWITFS